MEPYWSSNGATLYLGDVRACLRQLPSQSVHCVVTSPPYWKQRSYHNSSDVKHMEIGTESTPEEYVSSIVSVFNELHRVMRNDATAWLNLGDTFYNGQGMVPAMVAIALRSVGWKLVQDIIWLALNKMPESVTNRCSKSHEHVFLLAKCDDYYFDSEAIKCEAVRPGDVQTFGKRSKVAGGYDPSDPMFRNGSEQSGRTIECDQMVNKRDVWIVPVANYPGIHTATFNPKLIIPCILAGTSEAGCCAECGKSLERIVVRTGGVVKDGGKDGRDRSFDWSRNGKPGSGSTLDGTVAKRETIGWRKMCSCKTEEVVPCTVLDPFVGSGTSVAAAIQLGRHSIGIDLSEVYLRDHAIPRIESAISGEPLSSRKKSKPYIIPTDCDPPPPPKPLRLK